MGRSKETFSKKEKEKKRIKKRQDKEAKMEERKAGGKDSFDDMIAYVDENGNLTDTPPDLSNRREISLEEIRLGAADSHAPSEPERIEGRIDTFFHDKGFGFIKDTFGKSVFVHVSALDDTMDVGSRVTFETEQTPKGVSATNVRPWQAPAPPAPPAPPAAPAQ